MFGPWHYAEKPEDNPDWPVFYVGSGDNGGWVPVCNFQASAICNPGESRANAKAIAAVPDLIEACEMLLLVDRNGIQNVIDLLPAIQAAKAALQKAL